MTPTEIFYCVYCLVAMIIPITFFTYLVREECKANKLKRRK
jgi:hypothetical protein